MPDIPIQDYIRQEAQKAGIPPELALAVAQQESSFNPTAVNPASGATGVFQFIPSTAKARGLDAKDPIQNIQHGVRYLRELMDRHQGNVDLVLKEYGGVVDDTTYVPSVLTRMRKFSGQTPMAQTPPPAPRNVRVSTPMAPPAAASAGMIKPSVAGPPPSPLSLMKESTTGMLGMVGMDPTTPEGQRNLVATAVTLPIGGGLARAGYTGLRAALPVIAGAMTAGGGTQAVQDLASGAPPTLKSVGGAALEQGAYESGGQVVAWPLKATARRLVASKVGKNAANALSAAREHLASQLDTGLKAAQATADSLKQRLGMTAPTVSRQRAGTMAVDAIEGPAKTAKDIAGRAVDDAAGTGPAVKVQPLRDRLAELFEQITPQVGTGSVDADRALLSSVPAGAGRSAMSSADRVAYQQALARVQAADTTMLPPEHPLPRVLDYTRKVLGEADEIPFAELHKVKRMLDDAVNWNSPAKKQVEQITKGFRKTVRELLRSHQPYNVATENYRSVARLHDQGIAPRIVKAAESNPESITKLIKGDEPTKLQMMKDLLLQETAKGGDARQGEAAWNAVRASWTHENLVRGGVEKLGARIGKMDPDFQSIMYGDRAGQTVLRNLEQMSGAFRQAMESTASIQAAIRGAKGGTVFEKALAKSSLAKSPTVDVEGADALMAAFGPLGIWKARALVRMLKGPKLDELTMWASYSPQRTQMLVAALTNPAPGMMVTALARAYDLAGLGSDLMPEGDKEEEPSSPPPVPSRAAGAGPRADAGGPPPRPKTVEDVNGNLIPLQ